MRYRFSGSIPSKKNGRNVSRFGKLYSKPEYKNFLKSFEYQVRKNYPELFPIIQALPRPIHVVLHISRWRDDDWDFDNRMTTLQDVMVKIGLLPNDSYKTFLPFPGELKCDKATLTSAEDDYYEIEFVKSVSYERF